MGFGWFWGGEGGSWERVGLGGVLGFVFFFGERGGGFRGFRGFRGFKGFRV